MKATVTPTYEMVSPRELFKPIQSTPKAVLKNQNKSQKIIKQKIQLGCTSDE
jgi:hypothetical protein